MAVSYEHNPEILHLASAVSGLSEDQILKVRETPEHDMIVIDFVGNKRTYDFAEAMRAFQRAMNARRLRAAAVEPYLHGGLRQGAGRKQQADNATEQPTGSKRRGAGRKAGAEQ